MSRRSKKLKFRSNFEQTVSNLLKDFDYEPFRVPYIVHRKYCPDFVHEPSGTLVECKGFFREGDTKSTQVSGTAYQRTSTLSLY